MSNIYFICENCGIETNGITLVNGMKFCAKCYHQIFGKDNKQIEIDQLKQQLVELEQELTRRVYAKISRFIDKMKGVKFDERRMFVELENLKIEIQKEFEK